LACVETAAEAAFIAKLARGRTWVGASLADGKWTWLNDVPVDDKALTIEFSRTAPEIYLSWQVNQFRDTASQLLPFLCEWTPADAKDVAVAGQPAKAGAAIAQFVGEDKHTQGNWKKLYGKDGYVIQGDETRLPTYATLACESRLVTWDAKTDDRRALLRAGKDVRVAACWYEKRAPINFDLKITDGKEHTVAMYLLDWRPEGVPAKAEVIDVASGAVLDTRTVKNYGQGVYFVWRIKGAVKIQIRNADGGRHTFVSGVFFQ
jgi:hypothetical protein